MLSRSLIQYYRVFFFLSCCLSNNAHILAAVALQVFCRSQYPVPVVKGNKNKGSISHRIPQEQSCGLSRTKINISYLLDHIASSFGAVSENSFPYCFLHNMGVSADPLQKSRMLGDDCRHCEFYILVEIRWVYGPSLSCPEQEPLEPHQHIFNMGREEFSVQHLLLPVDSTSAVCLPCNQPKIYP